MALVLNHVYHALMLNLLNSSSPESFFHFINPLSHTYSFPSSSFFFFFDQQRVWCGG